MADYHSYKFDLVDDEGNVVDSIALNSDMAEGKAYEQEIASGRDAFYYMPDKDASKDQDLLDVYRPTTEAKVDVAINPGNNELIVSGPKWLVDDVVNSESFQKNYSKNNALKQLVSIYKADPSAAIPDADGNTKTALELLDEFQNSANNFASFYPQIKNTKLSANSMYGVDLSDKQATEMLTGYSKDLGYDKDGAVYVPDWAVDNYDWASLDSWDGENKTVSAEDFFKAYEEGWFNHMASDIIKESEQELEGFLKYNTYDPSDEEEAETRQNNIKDSSYAEELARTMHLYNMVHGNRPEVEASYNVALFTASTAQNFIKSATNAGYNVTSGITQAFDYLATETIGSGEANYFNPIYLGAALLGEIFNFFDGARGIPEDYFNNLASDWESIAKGEFGDKLTLKRDDLMSYWDEMNKFNQGISSAWTVGEFAGDMAWKIAENIAFLEAAGATVGGVVAKVGAEGGALATGISKLGLSSKSVANLFNLLGKGANWTTQGILETFIDDKQLLEEAFRSGGLTNDLVNKVMENVAWNAFADISLRGGKWFFSKTVVGQAISMAAAKPFALASYGSNTILHKIASAVNKNAGNIQEAAKAGKPWEAINTTLYKAKADAAKAILDTPILRQASEEMQEAIDRRYAWVLFGKSAGAVDENGEAIYKGTYELSNAMKEAGAKDAADYSVSVATEGENFGQGMKEAVEAKAAKDAAEETAEEATEDVAEATKKLTRREIINKNYENYRKMVLVRANLENSIDAISKGVSMKMSEINEAAGAARVRYTESASIVRELEARHGGLTNLGKRGFFSQESTDWLSLTTQKARAEWEAAALRNSGITSGDKLKKLDGFIEYANKRIPELEETLGDELVSMLGDFKLKLSAYDRAITDYMISHKYAPDDYANLINNLRSNKGWGVNGEGYIPTMRLFDNATADKNIEDFLKRLEDGDIFIKAKTVGDNPFKYKFSDLENGFVDPNVVIQMKIRGAATVAQASDLGRAVMAAQIPIKGVTFTEEGLTKADVSSVGMNVKKMKKDFSSFKQAFKKDMASEIQDVFKTSDPTGPFTEKATARTIAGKNLSDASRARAKAASELKRAESVTSMATEGGRSNVKALINDRNIVTDEDLMALMLSRGDDAPILSRKAINNMKAADFEQWMDTFGSRDFRNGLRAANGGKLPENVTQLKALVRNNPSIIRDMQVSYIMSPRGKAIQKSDTFKNMMLEKYYAKKGAKSQLVLQRAQKNYNDAVAVHQDALKKFVEAEPIAKGTAANPETYGEEFGGAIDILVNGSKDAAGNTKSAGLIDRTIVYLRGKDGFNQAVKSMVENGVDKELAERYVALTQLSKLSEGDIADALLISKGDSVIRESISGKTEDANLSDAQTKRLVSNLTNATKKAIKEQIDLEYFDVMSELAQRGEKAIDMDEYFNTVQKEVDALRKEGFSADDKGNISFDTGKYVQLVSPEGQLKFYQISPIYADLINNTSPAALASAGKASGLNGFAQSFSRWTGAIFRFGTTGIDKTSYINQWFRDSMNAILIGGAKPFTDLGTGGFRGFLKNMAKDYIPGANTKFGQRWLGEEMSAAITDRVVESTFSASEKGLAEEYGAEWLQAFKENATKGLSGAEAEKAYRRAVVEFAVDSTGASALPGLGGMTQAEFYSGGGKVTGSELRKNYYDALMSEDDIVVRNGRIEQLKEAQSKIRQMMGDLSKGSWREEFLRKSVYVSQYKTAIESGMSMQEAKIWATRYALDATTDFGRTFAFANDFIKSIPYLSASINGTRSFFRLLMLDPVGISTRITYGLTLPYVSILTKSLSDPKNRELYMNVPEYEKEDKFIFYYNGAQVNIPLPQEIAPFFTPFRHAVEKIMSANDNSTTSLIASDILGMSPLDLSGFVNLDANTILNMDKETGIGARIGRGLEKAVSSLMTPEAKAAYMITTGRDPYTGKEIDTSYVTIDSDGNSVVMDSTQNEFARWIHETWPNIPASGALKVSQALLGRSGNALADDIVALLTGSVKLTGTSKDDSFFRRSLNESAEALSKPVLTQAYNKANSDWRKAIDYLWDAKKSLGADEGFQKTLNTLRTAEKGTDKYNTAMTNYKSKVEEFRRTALEVATNFKQKYPAQYTSDRMAQLISALTISTDVPFADTASNEQISQDAYYESRNQAISSFVRMGFPTDHTDITELGVGMYNKNGEYEFKIFSPYEIQNLQTTVYNADELINAEIENAVKNAGIKTSDMWDGYYKAKDSGKAALKRYKAQWNYGVISSLYPLAKKYGTNVFLNNSKTRELLDDYIFIDNPYKTKQYLTEAFGGSY